MAAEGHETPPEAGHSVEDSDGRGAGLGREGEAEAGEEEVEEAEEVIEMPGMPGVVLDRVKDPSEEVLLLWSLRDPFSLRTSRYANQSALTVKIEACGQQLLLQQHPSEIVLPGVTGCVLWDSGIVLGKMVEHMVERGWLQMRGKNCIELGAGCGFTGCVASLCGANFVLFTDMEDRLRLLQRNAVALIGGHRRGGDDVAPSWDVKELMWGEGMESSLGLPTFDFVLAADCIYNEAAVPLFLQTLRCLCTASTVVLVASELRNDEVIEYFLEKALAFFIVGRLRDEQLHPEYGNKRVVVYGLKLLRAV